MPHPDMSESWVNGHPDEGLLHEWLDEQLSAGDATVVESHVAECDACRALVAEARGLIAASHRILSALDDVPVNVIPAQALRTADRDDVVSLASSRTRQQARTAADRKPNTSRWRNVGKIAALLLVALVPGVFFLRGDDVTVPMASLRDTAVADSGGPSSVATAAPVSAAAPSLAAPSSKVASAGAAERAPQSSDAVDRQRFAGELSKSAKPEREPQRSDQPAARAELDRRVVAAQPLSPAVTLTDSLARLRPQQVPSAELSGKVAGVNVATASTGAATRAPMITGTAVPVPMPATPPPVAAADQLAQGQGMAGAGGGRGGRGGGAGPGTTRAADSLSASPTSPAANNIANRAGSQSRADSASITRQIADAAQRAAAAATNTSESRQPSQILPRAAAATQLRASAGKAWTFDSVTLARTNCATACETAVLNINELGAVRYAVSSGSSVKPVVISQLSSASRVRLTELLTSTFAQAIVQAGSVRCTINSATGAPALEIVVANRQDNRPRTDAPCATSETVLRQLAAEIDEIVGTESLKRRVP